MLNFLTGFNANNELFGQITYKNCTFYVIAANPTNIYITRLIIHQNGAYRGVFNISRIWVENWGI